MESEPSVSSRQTGRLLLRYPVEEDAAPILDAFQIPQFPRQLPVGQIKNLAEVRQWIKRCQQAWLDGKWYSWILEDRETQALVGQITLTCRDEPGQFAIAFWIHPDYGGYGYATEAGERIMGFAFAKLGIIAIWAAAATWNLAS